jgi:hypothetical protein
MINPSEIRIGNFFVCHLEPGKDEVLCKVIWPHKEGIENQFGGHCPYKASNPIPLTPEWLERMGFKQMAIGKYQDDGNWHLKKTDCTIAFDDRYAHKDNNISYNGCTIWQTVKFVHQLQNLYFALTGEEFTIKENA